MEKTVITRKELYELVWSEPMTNLAKKYNISDVELRKLCKRKSIPLPPSGYWQKIRFGKKVPKEKLPKYSWSDKIELNKMGVNDSGKLSPIAELKALTREIEDDSTLPLKVPSKLTNPAHFINHAIESLSRTKRGYSPYYGVVETDVGEINIRVAPKNVGRALRFMDTFIKLLQARNHIFRIDDSGTYAVINNAEIEISFKERFKIVIPSDSPNSRQLHPSGILTFRIEGYPSKDCKDGNKPIEDQLAKILAKLELHAARIIRERRIFEERMRKLEEKLQKERKIKKHKKNEIKKFKILLQEANSWRQANLVREYIIATEQRAMEESKLTVELQNWISWATQRADLLDPLITIEDSLFNVKELLTHIRKNKIL